MVGNVGIFAIFLEFSGFLDFSFGEIVFEERKNVILENVNGKQNFVGDLKATPYCNTNSNDYIRHPFPKSPVTTI